MSAKYRLLTNEDYIEKGDECLNDDCETWHVMGLKDELSDQWFIGLKAGMPFKPIRRRVSADGQIDVAATKTEESYSIVPTKV